MLRSLRIENFRCFQRFELQQLGQLNLLVGTNNSGKTSILEAVQLLSYEDNLASLQEFMIARGEYILSDEKRNDIELDIRHLFYGHKIDEGDKFSILSDDHLDDIIVAVSIDQAGQISRSEDLKGLALVIEWSGQDDNSLLELQLSPQNGLSRNKLKYFRRDLKSSGIKSQFVTSSSLTSEKMFELFDQVVLTPAEELVIAALQIIEPTIDRIAPITSAWHRYSNSRSGFVVKLIDEDQRIPIGSMGDGIWRMLGLTLAIVNAKDGVLLVDEIDTGFHFGTMSDMWKLIWETAKRLNVQVFATTHNSDCWRSLAAIANTENPSEAGITIQRIEKDKPHSVVFTERQIAIAAERGIEVR